MKQRTFAPSRSRYHSKPRTTTHPVLRCVLGHAATILATSAVVVIAAWGR